MYGWKSILKYVKYYLKTENNCLKTQTKHPLTSLLIFFLFLNHIKRLRPTSTTYVSLQFPTSPLHTIQLITLPSKHFFIFQNSFTSFTALSVFHLRLSLSLKASDLQPPSQGHKACWIFTGAAALHQRAWLHR